MVPSVEFLGYRVDREGRHPTDEKIAATGKEQSGTPLLLRAAELLWTRHSKSFHPSSVVT